MIEGILADTNSNSYQLWLSDSKANNFRYKIFPEYKANREKQPRPKWYEELKEYLLSRWDARIAFGMEADDALGIYQDKHEPSTCICSIDKDLKMIPGLHYNFVKKEWLDQSREQGLNFFYRQILIGDKTTDNIEGCPGIGPVKAEKLLSDISDEQELFKRVQNTYFKQYKEINPLYTDEYIMSKLLLAGQLLKIRQIEDEPLWQLLPMSNESEERR